MGRTVPKPSVADELCVPLASTPSTPSPPHGELVSYVLAPFEAHRCRLVLVLLSQLLPASSPAQADEVAEAQVADTDANARPNATSSASRST